MPQTAPFRRLEDRIRQLCLRLATATDGDFAKAITELQAALNEHARRAHNRASAIVLAWPEFPAERGSP